MADQGRWFKLWCAALDDPALDILSISDFGRWAKFGTYLKKHGTDGKINIFSPAKTLCALLQIDNFDALLLCVQKFPNCNMLHVTNTIVTYQIEWLNWHKYQGDNSLERVRKYRAKKAKSVTPKKRREEKRREENIYSPNSDEFRLSKLLLTLIKERDKDYKEPNINSWAKHIDLMIRVDKRMVKEIESIIMACQKDEFWQNNILSTEKLRKQYDQLKLKLLPHQPKKGLVL